MNFICAEHKSELVQNYKWLILFSLYFEVLKIFLAKRDIAMSSLMMVTCPFSVAGTLLSSLKAFFHFIL